VSAPAGSGTRLLGRTALVTGGCGGIGRAVVDRFLREGATVYVVDLPGAATDDGSLARFLPVDVAAEDDVAAALSRIGAEAGALHVLVNTAAVEVEKPLEETSLEEWNRSFAVNVTGTYLTCRYALPLLRAAARGGAGASVVNLGSYDGFIADPGLAAYCATKGAVHALTRALACDAGPDGIRVNAVCPGYIDTPMLQSFFTGAGSGGRGRGIDELQQAVRDVHPLRRYGTPEDVANLVTWLASDEAAYASGQLWVLDGGLTAQVQQVRL
jgi:NAD(P)-dependent dehydrogenase (short-subunit alcohol dehydrogenase family)